MFYDSCVTCDDSVLPVMIHVLPVMIHVLPVMIHVLPVMIHVLPVLQQNQGPPVVHPGLAPQTPEKDDGTEVITIDEESPRLAPTSTSTTSTSTTASVTEKASSIQDKG